MIQEKKERNDKQKDENELKFEQSSHKSDE
jgi:hypothetical protein